ncbi:WXG100 family type VII secretion target [Actinomycetospora callitridis]|uniref:WXG100 family type VII secretion target n=1 Tax=Actinomycetospora callitridis TaxID=913944 RepID=UPI002366945B|nr:WXG100 family type VII secretion target [Actinomycetospora callitridis]MDD7920493.1 WXG100 family type VII secretion target [Actinomycetospora callitridis]
MPVPGVPWGGRDTSALSHELIHRWIHDGADPAALDSARRRHAARGEELRAAAQRLQRAHGELGASWRGRDADAATQHVRTLVARMSRLGDAVTGQAGSLQGVRDALARVQALVGPPRPPALPVLGASPATSGLAGALTTGGPPDGFGAFQAAQAEERAAQGAYRAYLEQTGLAARGAPSAVDGLAGRASTAAPGVPAPARGLTAGPEGAGSGRPGVLARAAGPAGPGGGAAGVGVRTGTVPGGGPAGGAGAPVGRGGAVAPGAGGPGAGARPGPVGRFVSRLLGGPEPGAPGAAGAGGAPGRPGGPAGHPGVPPGTTRGPTAGPAPGTVPGTVPAAGTARGPAAAAGPTPADRLAGGTGGAVAGRGDPRERRGGRRSVDPDVPAAPPEQAPPSTDRAGPRPGPEGPGPDRTAAAGPVAGTGTTVGAPADPGAPPAGHTAAPGHPATPGPDAPMVPPVTGAGPAAARPRGSGVRHPEYLVDADPWRDPADDPDGRRLVTPPVLGERDDL